MFDELRGIISYKSLESKHSGNLVVFYGECPENYLFFEPLIWIVQKSGHSIAYLYSDRQDPVKDAVCQGNFFAIYVGSRFARNTLFLTLKCRIVFMTTPELGLLDLKRSLNNPSPHYSYVFHSMVSCHSIYRAGAFNHFDSILCAGPHHERELRKMERHFNSEKKQLIPFGYSLIHTNQLKKAGTPAGPHPKSRILIAPTWHSGIFEIACQEFLEILSLPKLTDFEFVIRLHPETAKRSPDIFRAVAAFCSSDDRFHLDTEHCSKSNFRDCDIMISDWSGAAFEFSLIMEKPVIFIDTPQKILNSQFDKIALPAMERELRTSLGAVIQPDNLKMLPDAIQSVMGSRKVFRNSLNKILSMYVYDSEPGQAHVARLIENLFKPTSPLSEAASQVPEV